MMSPPTIKAPKIDPGFPIATRALTKVNEVPTTTGSLEPSVT